MAERKKFLTKEMVPIIVAIIGVAGTLGVGYFQFVWKPSHAAAQAIVNQYSGRILDAASQQPVVNAKITLYVPGLAPQIDYTDTEGAYLFTLTLSENQRSGRVRVEAPGYDPYDRNISLSTNLLTLGDLRLSKLPTPIPTMQPSETPTLLPSATLTVAATLPPSTETFTPLPPQGLGLSIDGFAFCEKQELDAAEICTVSKTFFPKGITEVHMSWIYRGSFSGTYSRVWYTDGIPSPNPTNSGNPWGGDGVSDETLLHVKNGFLPGEYRVEFRLDSNNQVIFEASFIVQ